MASLKDSLRESKPEWVSAILYGIARAVGGSLRMKVIGVQPNLERTIICGWHGRTFAFANFFRNRGLWVMISQSRDGEMQAQVFRRFGFRIIRGSTGRGGVRALVESIRALREGGSMAMTPDGPRGPTGIVQEGVMVMAHKGGATLVPAAFSASPVIRTRSWDGYIIPLPFAKAVMVFGDPLIVPLGASESEIEEVRLKLQHEMHRLESEADRMTGLRRRDDKANGP